MLNGFSQGSALLIPSTFLAHSLDWKIWDTSRWGSPEGKMRGRFLKARKTGTLYNGRKRPIFRVEVSPHFPFP
jgi:hypothetical protein